MEIALAACFGLLIGSFLNVCIYRLPRDLSVVTPRSFCPDCERMIAWFDNIPVVSYLLLGGKCRHCRQRISWRYPVVELVTGAVFGIAVWKLGLTLQALKLIVFGAIMVELIFSDLESYILPDEFTKGGIVIGIVLAFVVPMEPGLVNAILFHRYDPPVASVAESLIGALVAGGTLWLVGWTYEKIRHREGLGFGDVKMVALIGAFAGLYRTLVILILGSALGSVLGLAYILIARKDPASFQLPYGSFLGVAALAYALLNW